MTKTEQQAVEVVKTILEDYLEGDPKHLNRVFDYLGVEDPDPVESLLRSDRLTFKENA